MDGGGGSDDADKPGQEAVLSKAFRVDGVSGGLASSIRTAGGDVNISENAMSSSVTVSQFCPDGAKWKSPLPFGRHVVGSGQLRHVAHASSFGGSPADVIRSLRDQLMSQEAEIRVLRRRARMNPGLPKPGRPDEASTSDAIETDVRCSPGACVEQSDSSSGMSRSVRESVKESALSMADSEIAIHIAHECLISSFTKITDVLHIASLCQVINPVAWEEILRLFFRELFTSVQKRPTPLRLRDDSLESMWYASPWYYLYVQYTGTKDRSSEATFNDLIGMIPYIRHLGYRNVCLLPHYESPMGDCGYDVSQYATREALGGEEAFLRFMQAASDAEMRVATDAVFNHTSTQHPWFQKALQNDAKYLAYYVQRNGREKIKEIDRNGDIVCRYLDPDGTITERVCVFPDIDRTHGLWTEINSKTYQFYRGFYPFQVDLNLQNPEVLAEIFQILGEELNVGVLGKRLDALPHWIKQPGTTGDGLPETYALQSLLKSFMKHVSPASVLIPEVVRGSAEAATYAGCARRIHGRMFSDGGDALFAFEMQAALREMMFFKTVQPFWHCWFRNHALPRGAVWVNLLEHHDEVYLGFFANELRTVVREYVRQQGGVVFKNGMSAAVRHADCLDGDARRISLSIFLLYIAPGVPLMYAGLEIGWRHDVDFAARHTKETHERFRKLGLFLDEHECYDPRALHRGPIPKEAFEHASATDYGPVVLVRKLNYLWGQRPVLGEGEISPVDTSDAGVLGCSLKKSGESTLLAFANLLDYDKFVRVAAWHLCESFGIGQIPTAHIPDLYATDLVTGYIVCFSSQEDGLYSLTLRSYSFVLLEFAFRETFVR